MHPRCGRQLICFPLHRRRRLIRLWFPSVEEIHNTKLATPSQSRQEVVVMNMILVISIVFNNKEENLAAGRGQLTQKEESDYLHFYPNIWDYPDDNPNEWY